jgi:hypothetical protein
MGDKLSKASNKNKDDYQKNDCDDSSQNNYLARSDLFTEEETRDHQQEHLRMTAVSQEEAQEDSM